MPVSKHGVRQSVNVCAKPEHTHFKLISCTVASGWRVMTESNKTHVSPARAQHPMRRLVCVSVVTDVLHSTAGSAVKQHVQSDFSFVSVELRTGYSSSVWCQSHVLQKGQTQRRMAHCMTHKSLQIPLRTLRGRPTSLLKETPIQKCQRTESLHHNLT